MIRVLVVGINYSPEEISTGKYTAEMCEWLAKQGHEVRVVTAPPYYPQWRVWDGYRAKGYHKETINALDVVRCPIWVPSRPSTLTRVLHLSSFAVSVFGGLALSWKWKPNVIVTVAPTIAAAPLSLLFAKLWSAKRWLHIQDLEVDAMFKTRAYKTTMVDYPLLALERWLLKSFDRVSTISAAMQNKIINKGVDPARCTMLPNWADVAEIDTCGRDSEYRKNLSIPKDGIVALYSGNMGLKQGISILAEAAGYLQGIENLYFVFGGDGPARKALESACASMRNVRFAPLQPSDRLAGWLRFADIHLLPQRSEVAELVMPSKLTGMLASGRPVVATAQLGTTLANTIENCGLVVSPEDPKGFSQAILTLAKDSRLREKMGAEGRKIAVSKMSKVPILQRFESELLDLVRKTNS